MFPPPKCTAFFPVAAIVGVDLLNRLVKWDVSWRSLLVALLNMDSVERYFATTGGVGMS